jgi:hypothetical protein
VASNTAPGNFQITYRDTSAANRDLRLWMTDDGTANVYVGRTPVPDRADHQPATFFSNNYWRPSAIIRKRIASGTLSDLFVSVIEPLNNGVSGVANVERLPVTGSNLEACALKITFTDGRVDTYLVNLRNPQVAGANTGAATVSTADSQYILTGRIGAFSTGPSGSRVWTVDASSFQYPNQKLTTPDRHYSGIIAGETRKANGGAYDAFYTTTPLPLGTALRGQQLLLTFGTLSSPATAGISEMFQIDQVIFTNSQYHVVLTNDHQLEITNGTTSVEQMAPHRRFNGNNSFDIIRSASAVPISALSDLTLGTNTSSAPIAFSYGDLGATPGAALSVFATSSNPALIPNGNLLLGGSGVNRTLTLTPVPGQGGTSQITVSVTDGVWTNSRSFLLTIGSVNNPPTISTITNQSVLLGDAVPAIPFTVGDDLTLLNSLTLTGTSSNPGLLPNANIVFGGNGSNRTVTLTPVAGQLGTTTIQLVVDDGGKTATNTFTFTVTPPVTTVNTLFGDAGDASVYDNATVDSTSATTVLGAGGSSPNYVDRCTIYVFQLPNLGSVANPFITASFTFNYVSKQNTLKNNDLYGLGVRAAATVLGTDYYGQTATDDPTDATRLQTDILVDSSPTGPITTSAGGSAALASYLNAQYAGGAGVGKYVFLRLNDTGVKSGIARATLTMSEGAVAGPPDTRPQINFTIVAPNTAPVLATNSNQSLIAGQTLTITNSATDNDVPAQTLTFSLLSPPSGASINSSNGVFTWRPTMVQSPSTNPISVKVTDDGVPSLSATNNFSVTVLRPAIPVISAPGLSDGSFHFNFAGDNGPDYVVQASTDLTVWLPVWTNSLPPFEFTDSIATNFSQRFYRVLLGP